MRNKTLKILLPLIFIAVFLGFWVFIRNYSNRVIAPVGVPAPLSGPSAPPAATTTPSSPKPPPAPSPALNPTPQVPAPNGSSTPTSGLGRHFTDANFGSQLIQITNASDGKACYNVYSYWPSFNKDSTRFFIACDNKGILYAFDPVNFKIISKQDLFAPLPGGGLPDWQDAIWSGSDPNILYARQGLKIWAYNVSGRTYNLVKDFSQELPGKFLFQMSKSLDDNRFAFTIEDVSQNYAITGYMVWDRAQNKIIYTQDTSVLDEVQIDKSGQYLVVKTGQQGQGVVRVIVANLQNNTATNLVDGAPDFAPGHSDNGQSTMLGYDNWNNTLAIRSLADPHTYKTLFSFGNDWTQGDDISFLDDSEQWALVSQFTPGGKSGAGKYDDEIMLVAADGSGRVKQLAKTHSVVLGYWDQPRADISRDGRFVIFTSNRDGLREDAYLLKVNP